MHSYHLVALWSLVSSRLKSILTPHSALQSSLKQKLLPHPEHPSSDKPSMQSTNIPKTRRNLSGYSLDRIDQQHTPSSKHLQPAVLAAAELLL